MSYYNSARHVPTMADERQAAEDRACARRADERSHEAARIERTSARGGWNKATEIIAAIGFPRPTLVHALAKSDAGANAAMNVDFSYDRAEAATFIADDLDNIMSGWFGTENERKFIESFLATYLGARPEDTAWVPAAS